MLLSSMQSVTMQRVDGLQIAGAHCILGLDVNGGYQLPGLAD